MSKKLTVALVVLVVVGPERVPRTRTDNYQNYQSNR